MLLLRRLAAVAATCVVASCGGGGGGGGAPPADGGGDNVAQPGADYLPLNVGDVWYLTSNSSGVTEVRVTGTRVVGGRSLLVVSSTDGSDSTETLYEKSAAGVFEVPATNAGPLDRALAGIPALRLPLVAGQARVEVDQSGLDVGDIDGDGRADLATLRAEVTTLGFETLTTPAGTWNRVAHVRTVITQVLTLSASQRQVTVTGTSDDWYAPNIGPVRSQFTVVGNGSSQSDQQVITAFRVGAVRSESVPPTIAFRSPTGGSVGNSLALRVGFSEPMNRTTTNSPRLLLLGPNNQPVPGAAEWLDERTLAFVAAGPLTSGSYTASVAADVDDLVGNAVAGERSWAFVIDRDGPIVVSVTPAAGAVYVPLDGVVTIVFDEAPDSASLTTDSVRLSDSNGPIAATRSLAGRTLTLTPAQPLQRARTYTITVFGVRDSLGNTQPNGSVFGFQADTGRFALPQELTGLALFSAPVIAVDVDGDQRKDIVVLGAVNNPGEAAGIFVYRQLADGSQATPQRLALQSTCSVTGVFAADMDNDGRADLVVSHGCGMEVLRQTAQAGLATVAAIAVLPLGQNQAQAIRGSGRPGIAALPGELLGPTFQGAPRIWRQDAGGTFGPPVTVPSVLLAVYQLLVTDLDGDGLDDLVLWGLLSNGTSYGVELILQRSDGSFGPSREVAAPFCGGYSGVAAGDVNGDGRGDLVLLAPSCPSGDSLTLLMQGAGGSFSPSAPLNSAPNLARLQLADVDGDGRTDIVTARDVGGGVGVYLQRVDGTLAPEVIYAAPDAGYSLAIGDVTGDGLVDIISGRWLLRQRPVAPGASAVTPGTRGARVLKEGPKAGLPAAMAARVTRQ